MRKHRNQHYHWDSESETMVPFRKMIKEHLIESSSESDSGINSEDNQNILLILKDVIMKNCKMPDSGLNMGIERRLTQVFRRHPNPSPKCINKLSKELDISEDKLNEWFKAQSHKDFLESEKIKSMVFHVLMHAYLQKVNLAAANALFTHLQVQFDYLLYSFVLLSFFI